MSEGKKFKLIITKKDDEADIKEAVKFLESLGFEVEKEEVK